MYCIQCGRELPSECKFCPHCGASQTIGSSESTRQERGGSPADDGMIGENASLKRRPSGKLGEGSGRKRWTMILPVIGVAAVFGVILLINSVMSGRDLKCSDPAVFFGLEWEDGPYEGSYDYSFDETAPSGMDADTAWKAMEAYAALLEQQGIEVSLEDGRGAYIGDRYRLEADFGRYSLLNSGSREMFIHYYPAEQRFFLTLPYGYGLDRIDAIPTQTYSGALPAGGDAGEETDPEEAQPSAEESAAVSDAAQEPEDDPAPVITDTAVPDFQAFCNNNLHVHGVTEYSDYTEYIYFWKYNGKTMDEYLKLLQDTYHFSIRGEKVISSIDSYRYSFDYTGSGSAGTYDEDFMDGSDGEGIALYVLDLHPDGTTGEVHIRVADGLDYMDTGDRTTREVAPYETQSTSASSGGEENCWNCGGNGKCPTCGGTGTVSNWLAGTREYVIQDCTDCASPGKCRVCGGSGKA